MVTARAPISKHVPDFAPDHLRRSRGFEGGGYAILKRKIRKGLDAKYHRGALGGLLPKRSQCRAPLQKARRNCPSTDFLHDFLGVLGLNQPNFGELLPEETDVKRHLEKRDAASKPAVRGN
jgi:hypothetical protein